MTTEKGNCTHTHTHTHTGTLTTRSAGEIFLMLQPVYAPQAFKAQELELPRGGQTAPLASITLPDNFDDLQIDFLNESLFE